MAWYDKSGNEREFVVSTRVRFARNICDYPFATKLDKTGAQEIIEKARGVLSDYEYIDFTSIEPNVARSYVEKHFVSPNFLLPRVPHGLLMKDDTYVMLCEEDHLRIQCILPGLELERAYETAAGVCDEIESKLNIAFDERLGYLTHCPTNLGTGMRVSVMMFLPALTMTGTIRRVASQLPKMGVAIRGIYGEGTEESGCLYQISNQVTLGITEEDTVSKLSDIIKRIIENEKSAQKALEVKEHDRMCDMACRALGTMRSAYLLTSGEFMNLYGKVRYGLCAGYIDGVDYDVLDRLFIEVQPATLALAGGTDDAAQRDKARAAKVKKEME